MVALWAETRSLQWLSQSKGSVRQCSPCTGTRRNTRWFIPVLWSKKHILLPNRGGLDTKYSISLAAWIYPELHVGPILRHLANGKGVCFSHVAACAVHSPNRTSINTCIEAFRLAVCRCDLQRSKWNSKVVCQRKIRSKEVHWTNTVKY